jgi:hypothetical protein
LGAPVGVTIVPSTTRFVIVGLPLQLDVPLQPAVALEEITSAVIVSVNTVRFRLATEADDWLVMPEPVVEVLMTPVVSSPPMLAEARNEPFAPPSLGKGPESPRVVVTPRTVATTPIASPL